MQYEKTVLEMMERILGLEERVGKLESLNSLDSINCEELSMETGKMTRKAARDLLLGSINEHLTEESIKQVRENYGLEEDDSSDEKQQQLLRAAAVERDADVIANENIAPGIGNRSEGGGIVIENLISFTMNNLALNFDLLNDTEGGKGALYSQYPYAHRYFSCDPEKRVIRVPEDFCMFSSLKDFNNQVSKSDLVVKFYYSKLHDGDIGWFRIDAREIAVTNNDSNPKSIDAVVMAFPNKSGALNYVLATPEAIAQYSSKYRNTNEDLLHLYFSVETGDDGNYKLVESRSNRVMLSEKDGIYLVKEDKIAYELLLIATEKSLELALPRIVRWINDDDQ